jgi:ribonuclease D
VQSRRGLAVVRELWTTRDRIAQVADLSPRRVLPDTAIVDAARSYPANHAQLIRISGFAGRQARRHEKDWLAAVARARASADSELPETTGGAVPNGPPPAHRWAERDPAAAERLAAARAVVTDLATDSRLPVENLLSPDALRRLSWDPPPVTDEPSVARALAGYGARPWQIELTAGPVSRALSNPKDEVPDADVASLDDPSLDDPSLDDPSLDDPSLNDPSLNDPGLKDPATGELSPGDASAEEASAGDN